MVAMEFIGQLTSLNFVESQSLHDFADKCSCILSFIVVCMCFTIVTIKSYVLDPFSCYTATPMAGSSMSSYINAFCWVTGTIPGNLDRSRLDDANYWKQMEEKKMSYYQWVSFVLALQAILCYLPKLLWDTIIFNRIGTDLKFLIETAQKAANDSEPDRSRNITFVSNTIDTLLFARRKLKNPQTPQTTAYRRVVHLATELLPRKRLGNALSMYYFLVKCMYLFTACGQILLMERFLGLEEGNHFFGLSILQSMIQGKHWQETLIFPRVGFCRVPVKTLNAQINQITAQCSLPINMLNEKIYVFLWFWFVLISCVEAVSLLQWLLTLCIRRNRVRKIVQSLRVSDFYDDHVANHAAEFEKLFLHADGTLLLQMIRLNAGDIVANEVLTTMMKRFLKERTQKEDKQNNETPTSVDTISDHMLPPAYPVETDSLVKRRENLV